MMKHEFGIPSQASADMGFPANEVTPAVLTLLEIRHELREEDQALRDEIAELKGQKPRPKVKPSKLESGQKGASEARQASWRFMRTSA